MGKGLNPTLSCRRTPGIRRSGHHNVPPMMKSQETAHNQSKSWDDWRLNAQKQTMNMTTSPGANRVDAFARHLTQLEEKKDAVATKVTDLDYKVDSLGTSMATQFGQVMSQLALMYNAQQGGTTQPAAASQPTGKAKRTQIDLSQPDASSWG
eukprot:6477756-Amphidinium_carterae.3